MTPQEKQETFKNELSLIKDDSVRTGIKKLIGDIPDYFFTIPASSTGKYHPKFALGDGGLVRHTKACVMIAEELMKLEMWEKLAYMHDYIIGALILHDCMKNGYGEKYTRSDHPKLAKDFIMQNCININSAFILAELVETHMGQWNTDFKTGKEILKKPQSPQQKFVHMCDYLASRKFLEVQF